MNLEIRNMKHFLFCDTKHGPVTNAEVVFLVRKGKHLLEGLDKFKRHIVEGRISIHINNRGFDLSIYLYGLVTAVAVFRNPNTIPFCLATDLLLNILFSWLLVLLPSTFFLDVLFSSSSLLSTP